MEEPVALEKTIFLGAADGDDPIVYIAREWRAFIDALAYREGVCGIGHYAVSQRGAGANQSVDIAAGLAIVVGDTQAAQGKYVQRNNAVVNFTNIPAPPASGTRTHMLVLRINDKQAGSSSYDPEFAIKPDTGSGPPPAGPNEMALATIKRTAGQSSVVTADIKTQVIYAGTVPTILGGFEFWGGNGQSLARPGPYYYTPAGVRYSVGCTIPNPRQALVFDLIPGLWNLTGGICMDGSTNGDRHMDMIYFDLDPTFNRRILVPATGPGDGILGGSGSGEVMVRTGGHFAATIWQNANPLSHLNDSHKDLHFSGSYRGSIPGVF